MTVEIQIRHEETQDIEQIQQILLSAFPTEAESKLVDALQANGKGIISLVASKGDEVLGHILFSPVTTTPASDAKGLGLAPVAVRPDVQFQGIGARLIREGLQVCRELGCDYCVVLGDPHYYQRFGFEKASRSGIRNEYGVDEECMVLRFSDSTVAGVVQFAPEFGGFSV
jgi:putative acetyltransferase